MRKPEWYDELGHIKRDAVFEILDEVKAPLAERECIIIVMRAVQGIAHPGIVKAFVNDWLTRGKPC